MSLDERVKTNFWFINIYTERFILYKCVCLTNPECVLVVQTKFVCLRLDVRRSRISLAKFWRECDSLHSPPPLFQPVLNIFVGHANRIFFAHKYIDENPTVYTEFHITSAERRLIYLWRLSPFLHQDAKIRPSSAHIRLHFHLRKQSNWAISRVVDDIFVLRDTISYRIDVVEALLLISTSYSSTRHFSISLCVVSWLDFYHDRQIALRITDKEETRAREVCSRKCVWCSLTCVELK